MNNQRTELISINKNSPLRQAARAHKIARIENSAAYWRDQALTLAVLNIATLTAFILLFVYVMAR